MKLSKFASAFVVYSAISVSLAFSATERNPSAPRVPADQIDAARAWVNPFPATNENIAKGKALFQGKGLCTVCHGNEGRGDGNAGAALDPPPRNFHNPNLRRKSDGEFFWVIKNGIQGTGMVSYTPSIISEDEAALIVLYERSLHEAGPVPDLRVSDTTVPILDLSVPFRGVKTGSPSDRTIILTNHGDANLDIGTIALSDPIAAPFSIQINTCSGLTLLPRETCTLKVRFTPTSTGTFSDRFNIPSNDTFQNPATVRVSGTGLSSVTNKSPTAPQLVFPANGETGLGTDVAVGFNRSVDSDGDSVAYVLIICEDASFTTGCVTDEAVASVKNKGINSVGFGLVLIFGVVLVGLPKGRKTIGLFLVALALSSLLFVSCGGGGGEDNNPDGGNPTAEVTKTVNGLKTATTYQWKIVADDGNGGITESESFSFTTQ